jgi:predicted Rossmann fold nucleotide-binding protein DprA/Smf involved in DNA uptake
VAAPEGDVVKRTASALTSLLLTNRLIDVGARPLTSKEYWPLVRSVDDPAMLLGVGVDALVADLRFPRDLAERIARLLDAGMALAIEVEHLEQQGIAAVSPFDDAYPEVLRQRLRAAAPPVLYVAGPPSLLRGPGTAIVGSRNVSDVGAQVARAAASLVAKHRDVVISGGARGVDQLAMDAALQAGGPVVGVLADTLARRVRNADVRRAVNDQQLCLVTPYKPTAGFSAAAAMGRNKIVYALARSTLVVAADAERGGTWQGAVEALRKRYGHVAVWTGEGAGPGNDLLIEHGAHSVSSLDAPRHGNDLSDTVASEQLNLGV